MTNPKYTHIRVEKTLHKKLKQLAQQNGVSMGKLIEKLLNHVNIHVNIEKPEKGLEWWGRQDLNLGHESPSLVA